MFTFFLRIIFIILLLGGFLIWQSTGEKGIVIIEDIPNEEYSDEIISDEQEQSFSTQDSNQDQIEKPTFVSEDLPSIVKHKVPFVIQAPEGQWEDVRFQDACEEASILMAFQWAGDDKQLGKSDATAVLEKIFASGAQLFGPDVIDTSARDTAALMLDFFDYPSRVVEDVSLDEIRYALAQGGVVIVPTDGKKLGNPYFSSGGPDRHMLIITGYDHKKKEFIVNDPGTKRGKSYRYSYDVLYAAIRDYKTGIKEPIDGIQKNMIIISR